MTGRVSKPPTIKVRRHLAVLLRPVLVTLLGLVVAAVISGASLRDASLLIIAVWLAWGILLIRLIWKISGWMISYIEVNPQQLSLTSGIFTRRVTTTPLAKVTNIGLRTPFLGRALGYGELILEIGQDQYPRVFDYIPHADELYLEISNWIT